MNLTCPPGIEQNSPTQGGEIKKDLQQSREFENPPRKIYWKENDGAGQNTFKGPRAKPVLTVTGVVGAH